ncbi:DNA-3-methyladenine glycosylase [Pseudomonas xanthosomatis]|uniref:DNA-3-methyladenine glycosylase n=1 Tax=Pseudomonas xanthosomatis TaxID=2842356 RepID=UPI003515EF24
MKIIAGQPVDELELPFTPPLDWARMLRFFGGRATGGVETVLDGVYHRTLALAGSDGLLSVRKDPARDCLLVRLEGEASRQLGELQPRLARQFDLLTHPEAVRDGLGQDPWLAERLHAVPGLRVPGAWSGFELVIRTIIGQQVSVKAATTITGRLVERTGTPAASPAQLGIPWHFPSPRAVAEANLDKIGMPGKRVAALQNFARVVAEGELLIDSEQPDTSLLRRQLLALPGIGPWTVEYVAMRAWRDPDAWPATDLVLMQAITRRLPELASKASQARHAESWRPWRAYVAMHLWNEIADQAGVARGG